MLGGNWTVSEFDCTARPADDTVVEVIAARRLSLDRTVRVFAFRGANALIGSLSTWLLPRVALLAPTAFGCSREEKVPSALATGVAAAFEAVASVCAVRTVFTFINRLSSKRTASPCTLFIVIERGRALSLSGAGPKPYTANWFIRARTAPEKVRHTSSVRAPAALPSIETHSAAQVR
ncbi:MAG TPA: hypothetical protein VGM11_12575 [Acidobacteriaceae bacterium]